MSDDANHPSPTESDGTESTSSAPSSALRPDEVEAGHGEHGDSPGDALDDSDEARPVEAVTEPAKVMRIGSMVKQLLEEVRAAGLDEASRERLAEVYERSIVELSGALSEDLQDELRNLALPFDHDDVPSDAELRVAKAQLVGWLEGLFHGIQASLMAQQFAAQQQLQQMRELPGQGESTGQGSPQRAAPPQTGTYL
ncbi:MAG: proteasome activator [Ilumatobacter sp.]|uniref:proteasome activator n=1 Tax=Ilumatobacter sp. TaxID=1967498 RepID=UPI00391A15C5